MRGRRPSAFLTRRPLPLAEVRCEGCYLWRRVELTRHVTLHGPTQEFVLCLDCADRVERVEAQRPGYHESAGDMLSRQASYYHP